MSLSQYHRSRASTNLQKTTQSTKKPCRIQGVPKLPPRMVYSTGWGQLPSAQRCATRAAPEEHDTQALTRVARRSSVTFRRLRKGLVVLSSCRRKWRCHARDMSCPKSQSIQAEYWASRMRNACSNLYTKENIRATAAQP